MKAVWMQGILADFLAAEPLCPQGSLPHAQTKHARNWLLDSSGPVLTSLYYARVNSLRRHPSFHASLESDCIQRQARLEFRQTGGLFVTHVLAGSGSRWPRHRVSIVPHGNLGRVVNGERGVALKTASAAHQGIQLAASKLTPARKSAQIISRQYSLATCRSRALDQLFLVPAR